MADNITMLSERMAARPKRKDAPLLAAIKLLRNDPAWKGLVAWNEFANRVVLRRSIPGVERIDDADYPREMRDIDISDSTAWLQERRTTAGSRITEEALLVVAHDASFHPVREYLKGLVWDGVDRLDTWTIEHLGAESTDFNRVAGRCWCIAAVARVMRPGCQMKNILVLEGAQDLRKSAAVAAMACRAEWYADHLSDLNRKDALEETQGKWMIEFAEMAGMRHREANRVKAFLSTSTDRFRVSYGHVAEDHPRQWVGIATINPEGTGYLQDETGNVRYWPIACGVGWDKNQQIDVEKLMAARDQLWAEAYARFQQGEAWWFNDVDLRQAHAAQVDARAADDPRENTVRAYVEGKPWVQMHDILIELEVPRERHNKALQTEIGGIVARLGWVRHRCQTDGPNGVGYYYFPPGSGVPRIYAQQQTVKNAEADATQGDYGEEAGAGLKGATEERVRDQRRARGLFDDRPL